MSRYWDRESFSRIVPLFPLPGVVLFPRRLLPLHIFEPRYLSMTRAALAGEQVLGMALFKPGWQGDYNGSPPIHPVIGLGRIVRHRERPDGTMDLLLRGVSRARVVAEVPAGTPYRMAKVDLLQDIAGDIVWVGSVGLGELLERLDGAAEEQDEPSEPPSLGEILDRIADSVLADPAAKQLVLDSMNVAERARLLLDLIHRQPSSLRVLARKGPSAN